VLLLRIKSFAFLTFIMTIVPIVPLPPPTSISISLRASIMRSEILHLLLFHFLLPFILEYPHTPPNSITCYEFTLNDNRDANKYDLLLHLNLLLLIVNRNSLKISRVSLNSPQFLLLGSASIAINSKIEASRYWRCVQARMIFVLTVRSSLPICLNIDHKDLIPSNSPAGERREE
jgi:hypothetical protein